MAGVHPTPGAVEAGALSVLTDPATGIADGVGAMADALNARVRELDAPGRSDDGVEAGLPAFVALAYEERRAVLARLTSPDHEERELWFLMALFAYMAYDSAPHLDTAEAMRSGHPGLTQLGFAPPGADGLWRAERPTYGRSTALPRAGTDAFGNLS